MRVAIYGRVSTGRQVEHQTIEQQLGRLTEHVRAHAAVGWALDPAHVFRDDGYSGGVLARPGLDRLRDAIKGREVDRVLVTAPDGAPGGVGARRLCRRVPRPAHE
jgi:site-specific DNA recombinase